MKIKRDFIDQCIVSILNQYDRQSKPIDVFLSHFFRAHRSIGSKKRREICEIIYFLIRWHSLIDYFSEAPKGWENRLAIYRSGFLPENYLNKDVIPHHVRLSFPKPYYDLLAKQYSRDQLEEICLTSNEMAPTTIRINPMKTTRRKLIESLQDRFEISPTTQSELGICFQKKTNFFAMEEFKQGLFEVQDEGSQLVADLVNPKPQDHVLDFCAGSGGKTLGFAHKLKGTGQIYLYDIRSQALKQAKKRMQRAGIQNAQIITHEKQWAPLIGKMDWILLDVPCSGSGTLRRNSDMKWKFREQQMQELIAEQRKIFERALLYLKKDGKIVYSTCSLFQQENGDQIDYFQKHFPIELAQEPCSWLPQKGGMDGFFAAVCKYKSVLS